MREILFRGKDKDGNWVEGDLIHDYIAIETVDDTIYDWPDPIPASIKQKDCFPVEVVQETVGQYIGKKDINNKMIFTGDITSRGNIIKYNEEKCLYAEHASNANYISEVE